MPVLNRITCKTKNDPEMFSNPKPVGYRNYIGEEYFVECGVSLVRLFL